MADGLRASGRVGTTASCGSNHCCSTACMGTDLRYVDALNRPALTLALSRKRARGRGGQQVPCDQPRTRVFGIALEPRARGAETERVAPAIHVVGDARAADAGQRVAEHDLE